MTLPGAGATGWLIRTGHNAGMRRLLRFAAAVLLATLLAPAALAQALPPPIVIGEQEAVSLNRRSAYWVDRQGQSTPQTLEAQPGAAMWRLRARDQQSWAQGGVLWVTFAVAVPRGERWYLEVGTSGHSKVQLFHRDGAGAWAVQQAGTELPVTHWAVHGRLPTFRLDSSRPEAVRYWLRVEDERDEFIAPLRLLREEALRNQRELEQFLFGGYFGLAALVLLASLVHGIAWRDRGFLAFALYIFLLALGQLGYAGIGAQHLWPEWLGWNGTMLALWPGAAMAGALWFVRTVTDPARLSRRLDLAVWGLLAALLASTALHTVVTSRTSSTLVLSFTGLALAAVAAMVLWSWRESRERHLGLVAAGFLALVAMAAFPLARTFGLVPPTVLTRFSLFFGVALQLPILYYALNMRLMARRESELRASALSHTDALTGLPHRQALVQRLDASLAHARGQKQQFALLAVRVSNLEAIAGEFGREAAEKALVVAASHMRRAAFNFDMAARVGEREFCVLQEAPVTPPLVTSRAQQIVASGLRPIESLPAALTLKFHVAAALVPEPTLDGAASLQWVLDGLDQIEPEAKKLIRPLNF